MIILTHALLGNIVAYIPTEDSCTLQDSERRACIGISYIRKMPVRNFRSQHTNDTFSNTSRFSSSTNFECSSFSAANSCLFWLRSGAYWNKEVIYLLTRISSCQIHSSGMFLLHSIFSWRVCWVWQHPSGPWDDRCLPPLLSSQVGPVWGGHTRVACHTAAWCLASSIAKFNSIYSFATWHLSQFRQVYLPLNANLPPVHVLFSYPSSMPLGSGLRQMSSFPSLALLLCFS